MRKSFVVNKITGGKNNKNIELVENGYMRSYGGCIAIGYSSGNKSYELSVSVEDLEEFINQVKRDQEMINR
jgi:hypothetical protein